MRCGFGAGKRVTMRNPTRLRFVVPRTGFACIAAALIVLSACDRKQAELPSGETDGTDGEEIVALTKPWEKPVPFQKVPKGLTTLSAEECGKCHDAIYNEWKRSFHAQAWEDPQFQSEWAKDDSLWVCINCHIPLQNQQPEIVTGKIDGDYFRPVKRDNPNFDPKLREESITCAACHVRDGYVIGPYGNQRDAPHAVKQDTVHLSEQLCFRCHNVTDVLNPSLVCVFNTGNEWLAGPYPALGRNCISCHMPYVERPLSTAGPPRRTRKHTWIGSGIPKSSADRVEEVQPMAGYIRGLDVRIQADRDTYHRGEKAYFTVTLINQRAGHRLPTGDPEYFYTLHLEAVGGKGDTLATRTVRIGQEWKWWPKAEKLSDNRLKPLEERSYSFSFEIPYEATKVGFRARLVTHRMSWENARFNKLLKHYPLSAEVFNRVVWVLK
ncbi:MAG: cytochrome C554 and C-prime [Calditrichaeota bacterium]|nr:MAG: cytochrome C554 and C-prime [Calditrichota bacterium]